jgi:hypothetical protein
VASELSLTHDTGSCTTQFATLAPQVVKEFRMTQGILHNKKTSAGVNECARAITQAIPQPRIPNWRQQEAFDSNLPRISWYDPKDSVRSSFGRVFVRDEREMRGVAYLPGGHGSHTSFHHNSLIHSCVHEHRKDSSSPTPRPF